MLPCALRAAVAGWAALVLASVAHVLEHGALPGAGVLVAMAAGVAVIVAPLLRRPPSVPGLTALLLTGQLGLHTAFTLLSGHGENSEADMDAMTATHDPGAWLAGMARHLFEGLDPRTQGAMLLAHALAGLALAWWLCTGEGRILHVARLASRHLLAPARLWRAAAPAHTSSRLTPRGLVVPHAGWAVAPSPDSHPVVRRGPPASLLAV